jgi:aminotransferase EvaB
MQIPINDLKRQYDRLAGELTPRIAAVLSRGIFLFGTETKAFEAEFASYCGVRHCISVANGTDAIELALRAAGCDGDSEVITVANAGSYSTTACNLVGATPVYVDIDRSTLGLRIDAVQEALTPRTRCLIVTHLYGLAVDVPALRRALEAQGRSDVIVIEDCAQAHGARLGNGVVGSFGDLATFSFYPTKNLGAAGDGGAVLTGDDAMAEGSPIAD